MALLVLSAFGVRWQGSTVEELAAFCGWSMASEALAKGSAFVMRLSPGDVWDGTTIREDGDLNEAFERALEALERLAENGEASVDALGDWTLREFRRVALVSAAEAFRSGLDLRTRDRREGMWPPSSLDSGAAWQELGASERLRALARELGRLELMHRRAPTGNPAERRHRKALALRVQQARLDVTRAASIYAESTDAPGNADLRAARNADVARILASVPALMCASHGPAHEPACGACRAYAATLRSSEEHERDAAREVAGMTDAQLASAGRWPL